jgi:hypothetical protein
VSLNLENSRENCYVDGVPIEPPAAESNPQNRRRSKRIKTRIPVVARFQTADKLSVSEETHTLIVNDHGALILLRSQTEIQQIVRLERIDSGAELLCRVTTIGASFMGKTQVAVEFIMPAPGFWGKPT